MPRATSGTPATRTARSAISIPRPARSPSSRCPIPRRRTRTRWCSTARASPGSRCRTATWSAGSIPASGDIKLVTLDDAERRSPTASRSTPRAIPGSRATASPCLYKIDPANMALTEVKLPLEGTTVRRLDIADDGIDLVRQLGARPARPLRSEDRRDQGMAVAERAEVASLRDRRGRRHRLVQRVRACGPIRWCASIPKTETFQSWAIPSGNIYAGIIRHMRAARDGSLLIHQSSTNRIIQVTVQRRAASR